jgi:hypothetical protein
LDELKSLPQYDQYVPDADESKESVTYYMYTQQAISFLEDTCTLSFGQVADTLSASSDNVNSRLWTGINVLNIIITCFIFGYIVTSIVFLLNCISKGVDSFCLRLFRIGMPAIIWLVLFSVLVMENIAFFRAKS